MHTFLLSAENWYLVCFGVGLALSVLTFFGGFGHLQIGHFHGGHFHLTHTHAGHLHTHASGARDRPLAAQRLHAHGLSLLVWRNRLSAAPLQPALELWAYSQLAVISGLAGAAIIFWFLARVLLPRERVLTAEDTEMTGVLARVSSPIREGGTGEIAYSQGGARRAAAARSDAGAAIARDVEVVVLRYERGIAYVRPWSELEGPPAT